MKNEIEGSSYLHLTLYIDEGETYELKVPTFWDECVQTWRAILRLPISKKILHTCGYDSFELQNNMNLLINKCLNSEKYFFEIMTLFKQKDD